jgi:septum formation protein
MRVILASQSPRRAAILDLARIDYEVIPSDYVEKIIPTDDIEELSISLAYGKAKDVFDNTQGLRAVIGADTMVVKDNNIYGKPTDRQNAIEMLTDLQGDIHSVYTSLVILIETEDGTKEYKEVIKTDISVNPMSREEIEEYIDVEEPMDKAGAYAIQSSFARYIDAVEGNYMSVIGLPVDRVYAILKENDCI